MLIPAKPLLASWALVFLGAVGVAWMPEARPYFYWGVGILLVLLLVDALLLWLEKPPQVRRQVANALPLWSEVEVTLRFENQAARTQVFTVYDHLPSEFETQQMPAALRVPRGGFLEFRYRVRALERGAHRFGTTELRIRSRVHFWHRRVHRGPECDVRVYPNFSTLTRYALMATDHHLSQIGVLKRRRRGSGSDFEQLREYREGDTQRQIDWKAGARMGKLISRQYQDERDQQIVLLIDCGRRMQARDGALSHMDHVLNAALLLAYVGLRQGDAVGALTLAGYERWLAPRKSVGTINTLLNAVYDIQPTAHNPDFHAAAMELTRRLRKRALVVLVSNLRDEDDDTLLPAVRLLQQRHLVLVASLREAILAQALERPVANVDAALTQAAAADYLERRRRAFNRLERMRVPCVDVEPGHLAIALVNRYIDIKRSGRM